MMVRHLPLLVYLPFCVVLSPSHPIHPPQSLAATDKENLSLAARIVTFLGPASQASFPANLPWAGLADLSFREDSNPLPDQAAMESLAHTDPIAFMEHCLRRYQRTVFGYQCLMEKQEWIDDKLQDREKVQVAFRERPFSVYLRWVEGARKVDRALYVRGENDGNVRIRTRYIGLLVSRDPEGKDARQAGRYTLKEFGLKMGSERVLDAFREAAKQNRLDVEFLGEQVVAQAGGRTCWVLHRKGYATPEEDGITDLVLYIDKETWLQVGSVLRGENGRLIAEYFFRDLLINPSFGPEQFTDHALR